jgi:hypothetical protein
VRRTPISSTDVRRTVGLVALCLLAGCVEQRVRADLTRADLSLLGAPGMTVM